MRTLALALGYFALVFGAGFLLGPPRVLLLEPRVGERVAQLVEMPLMLIAIGLAARLVARHGTARQRIGAGLLATLLILAADAAVGVLLRGMTPRAVFADRDPVAGAAYYASLAFCAAAPWLAGRRRPDRGG